ncbi:MAG: hypothetical protein ACNI22_16430 [Halarcobacter sp.]
MCDKFEHDTNKLYLCIPYSISNDLDFIVSIVSDTKEDQTIEEEYLLYCHQFKTT